MKNAYLNAQSASCLASDGDGRYLYRNLSHSSVDRVAG
jgi:hypothetical protein